MAKPKKKQRRINVKTSVWRRRVIPVLGILIFAGIGTYLLQALFAAGPSLSTTLYATHPYASKAGYDSTSVNYYTGAKLCSTNFCPVGQVIRDIQITDDGELIAGYGDWDSNVDSFGVAAGKVGIVPLNLSTNTWGSFTAAGSESLDSLRKINGKIYAPTTDPSDTLGSKSGYMTNESGTWELKADNQGGVHTFDVVSSNGTDRWETGGASDGPGVWRSVNNDGSWTREPLTTGGFFGRFYWAAALNGKVYVQGAVHDGTSWNTSPTPCSARETKAVVVWEGAIYCRAGSSLVSFDGTTRTTLIAFTDTYSFQQSNGTTITTTESVRDLYTDTSGLYVLSDMGKVYHITPGTHAVKSLGTVNGGAHTLAYYEGYLYFGHDQGKIYRSNSTLSSITTSPVPSIMSATAVSPTTLQLDGSTQNVTITGTGLPADVSVKIGKTVAPVVSRSSTQVIVSLNTASVIKNDRFRKTGSKYLTVALSAPNYDSATNLTLLVNYTR